MRNGLVSALCIAVTALLVLPAAADITAFNKAVKAGDYKTAAAEAMSAWPSLDKSRQDIALIAREFGYAAYVAANYPAARDFAQFAVDHPAEGADRDLALAISGVLLRTAQYRIKESPETRKQLVDAMAARSAQPGFDNVSFLGVDALVAADMDAGKWTDATASANLGITLTAKGGGYFLPMRRRLELFAAVAEYMDDHQPATLAKFVALNYAVIADMDAASSDAMAAGLAPFYWEAASWTSTIVAHIYSSHKQIPADLVVRLAENNKRMSFSPRVKALLHRHDPNEPCIRVVKQVKPIKYPPDAMYAGFVGSVTMKTDIDSDGKPLNYVVLASVPQKLFGDAALKSMKSNIRFEGKPGAWNDTCEMAHKDHIVEFNFIIAR